MIGQRVFNTPLMVDPVKGHAFLTGLGGRLTDSTLHLPRYGGDDARLERASRVEPRMSLLGGELAHRYADRGRRMFSMRDGIAIIEMTGTLVHRGDWLGEASGSTSYEGLAQQVDAAVADPSVRAIALEMDSFGGQVAGVFDLADAIRAARAHKPVWAFVAETALSAGYALASQADRIILPRTGEVGSVGILIMHADYSQRLSDEGVQITMIHAGANKVDGNPYEPLPEAVRDQLQGEVENLRTLFADTVAAGRGGRLTAQAVLDTQARVFRGAEAVALGLADEVSDMRAAFARFAEHIHRRASAATPITAEGGSKKEPSMNASTQQAAADTTRQNAPAADDVAVVETAQENETPATDAPVTIEEAASAVAPVREGMNAASLTIADAAAIAEIGAQASRLGINIDVPKAIREGHSPDALRARVLEEASARDAASSVVAVTPAASSAPKESPIVSAAKRAAAHAASRIST